MNNIGILGAIREQWDPLSLSQSVNLATTLNEIIDDYPVANCSSKRMKEVIKEASQLKHCTQVLFLQI